MRKYEPIWIALKSKRIVSIHCQPAMIARLRKAVIKEKDKDTEFKDTHCTRLAITRTSKGLDFTLYDRSFFDD